MLVTDLLFYVQARTTAPLCLSPSLQTSRIANSMLHATTLRPPKRKRCSQPAESDDPDDGEESQRREREEREKMMKLGDEGVGRARGHAYVAVGLNGWHGLRRTPGLTGSVLCCRFARMAFIQSYRERQANPTLAVQPGATATSIRIAPPAATPKPNAGSPPPPAARPKGGRPSIAAGLESEAASPAGTPAGTPAASADLPVKKKKKNKKSALAAAAAAEGK